MPKDPVYGTYIALAEGDVSLSDCLSVCHRSLSLWLSGEGLSVCLSFCLSVCLSVCPSMHLIAVCLSFHLSAVWSVPRDPV